MCSSCGPVVIGIDLAPRPSDLTWRDVASVPRRLPGEPGTSQPRALGRPAGRREAADAVLEHGPRRSGPDGGQRREHEDVRVPKDMPRVGVSGQAPRPDGGFLGLGGRREQVEDGEPRRQLGCGIPFDHHLGVSPPRGPRLAVLGQQRIESDGVGCRQPLHSVGCGRRPPGVVDQPARRSTTRRPAVVPTRSRAATAISVPGPARPGDSHPVTILALELHITPDAWRSQWFAGLKAPARPPRPAWPWRAAQRPRRTARTEVPDSSAFRNGRAFRCAGRGTGGSRRAGCSRIAVELDPRRTGEQVAIVGVGTAHEKEG